MNNISRFHILNASLTRGAVLGGASAFVLGLASPLVAVAQTAAAQGATGPDSDTQLEEVVVTAQRRSEDIQQVPISVTAFSAADIVAENIQGMQDVVNRTPNVTFIIQGSRDRTQISIRGISNLNDPLNLGDIRTNTFGFYIDDFDVSQATQNPEVVDLDRIEILRGPQGTFFGKNAAGGAINITTKQPTNEFYAEGTFAYSRFNTVDINAVLNVPIVEDKLSVRVAGSHEQSDGNIRNINPIGGGDDSTYDYGRIIAKFTPTDNLTFTLNGAMTNERTGALNGVPSGVLGPFSRGLYFGGNPNAIGLSDGVGFYPANTHDVNFGLPQSVGTHFFYTTGRLVYTAEDFTVTSISGYLHERDWNRGDIDQTSLDEFYEINPAVRDSASEELRVQSNPDVPLEWTAGALVGRERGQREQNTYAGPGNPFGLPTGFNVTSSGSSSQSQQDSYAVFGDLTWHVMNRLKLVVGARYSIDQEYTIVYDSPAPHTLVGTASASFHDFSPRFSVEYQVSDGLNAYATISKGYKAGGVEVDPAFSLSSYQPETIWNYEGGLKGEFLDRRLRTSISAYYMDWSNLQVGYGVGEVSGNTVTFIDGIENAAKARSYGFEGEVDAQVMPRLTVTGSAGYENAKFVSYPNAYVEGAILNLNGATMPNAPRWTLNSSAEYRMPLPMISDDSDGFIRLEWFYRGANAPNLDAVVYSGFPWKVPSYNQFNLRAGYDSGPLTITAFIENLSGKQYYLNEYEKAFAGGVYVEPVFQNFGVRATYRY